jgi:hypothetical protein
LFTNDIVLKALEDLGCEENVINFFKSYLSNRKQYVQLEYMINNNLTKIKSEVSDVKEGVRQGAKISPDLFKYSYNDLINYITEAYVSQFADDKNLLIVGNDIEEVYNKAKLSIKQFESWCKIKKLIINADKCQFMQFNFDKNNPYSLFLKINNKIIPRVEIAKILGLYFDENFDWIFHFSLVNKKLTMANFMVFSAKQKVSQDMLLKIYYAYFYSHVSYYMLAWASNDKILQKLFLLQKIIVRNILKIGWKYSCRNKFKDLKMLTIPSLIIYLCCIFIFEYELYIVQKYMACKNMPSHASCARKKN